MRDSHYSQYSDGVPSVLEGIRLALRWTGYRAVVEADAEWMVGGAGARGGIDSPAGLEDRVPHARAGDEARRGFDLCGERPRREC